MKKSTNKQSKVETKQKQKSEVQPQNKIADKKTVNQDGLQEKKADPKQKSANPKAAKSEQNTVQKIEEQKQIAKIPDKKRDAKLKEKEAKPVVKEVLKTLPKEEKKSASKGKQPAKEVEDEVKRNLKDIKQNRKQPTKRQEAKVPPTKEVKAKNEVKPQATKKQAAVKKQSEMEDEKKVTGRRGRRVDYDEEASIEFSDPEDTVRAKRSKKKPLKAGVPRNAKPDLPKLTKKKQAAIPPEFQLHLEDPAVLDSVVESEYSTMESRNTKLIEDDCCVNCTNKNVHRACKTHNVELLKQCIGAQKKVSGLLHGLAPEMRWTPAEWAVYHSDFEMLQLLIESDEQKGKRVFNQVCQLTKFDTGMVSESTYGTEIRKVNMARGNRQGNNAFVEEPTVEESNFRAYLQNEYFIERMLHMEGFNLEFVKRLIKLDKPMENFLRKNLLSKILLAGKVDITKFLMEPMVDDPIMQVNKLMFQVLDAADIKALPDNYNKLSVQKVCGQLGNVNALHLASLNPNIEILKKLLNMVSAQAYQKFTQDNEGNQCIHYAAACVETGPLELLIARDLNVNFANNNKETPIFIAIKNNRPQNIVVILGEDDESIYYKDSHGYYPIHLAAKLGHYECVKALCKIDKKYIDTIGGYAKMSGLMYAAAYGHFETVRDMVLNLRANINLVDKHGRSALTYAVRNGHLKIAAFLLQHKAFYNYPDTSGNTPLHYACAYGWFECVRILLRVGANPNAENDWKYTPLIIAMLKGHKKIVKFLLDIKEVDVNGTDEYGRNLLCFALSQINDDTKNYIRFLIKEKQANPHQRDSQDKTPIFYLLEASLPYQTAEIQPTDIITNQLAQKKKQEQQEFRELFKYLVEEVGCLLDVEDKAKDTPISMIFKTGKLFLIDLVVKQIDIVKQPQILFSLNPYLTDSTSEIISFLKSLKNIPEEVMNCVNYQGCSVISFYMKIYNFNYQHTIRNQFVTYLDKRRRYEAAQILELGGTLDKLEPKETYYMNIIKKEMENLDLETLQRIGITFNLEKIVDKEKLGQINNFLNSFQAGVVKDETQYATKAAELIVERVTKNFLTIMKEFVRMGASLRTYIIDPQEIVTEYYPKEQEILKTPLYYLKLTEEQNLRLADKLRTEFQNMQKSPPQATQQTQIQFFNLRTQKCSLQGIVELAIDSKNIDLLRFVLKEGADVNQLNHLNLTPLIKLSKEVSSLDQFTQLYNEMEKYNLDTKVVCPQMGNAFLIAFTLNHIDVAKFLLDNGYSPNSVNKKDETALMMAINNKDYDLTELILEKGANPNIQDKKGRTALHYAVNNSSSSIDAQFDLESLLISFGAKTNIQDKIGRTPLHYAFVKIGKGKSESTPIDPIETVASLCTSEDTDPKIADKFGKTALHYAAQRAATISTMYLEKKGVDLDKKDIFNNTPLAVAMLNKHSQYAIMLIKQGSNVNQLVHPETKQAYEEYKKQQKEQMKENIVEVVEEKDDESSYFGNVQTQMPVNYFGGGSLFGNQFGTIGGGMYGYTNHLQNNYELKQPQSMFKLAVEQGQLGLSYLILDNGFDILSAMEDSLKKEKFNLVLTLLSKVSDNKQVQRVNGKGQNLFHILAQNAKSFNQPQQLKLMQRLFKNLRRRDIKTDVADNLGRLPIHYACLTGCHALLKEFLTDNPQVANAQDSRGLSPLVYSIKGKRVIQREGYECFKTLVELGQVNPKQIYRESLYKEDLALTQELKEAKIKEYKLSSLQHIFRSLKAMQPLQNEWLSYVFGPKIKASLFEQDSIGRDTLMLLVIQNDLEILKKVYQVMEDQQKIRKEIMLFKENKDVLGRTVIHYVVRSSQYGTYDNIKLFEFLIEKGFKANVVDKEGKNPVDYAKSFKNSKILKKLEKLGIKEHHQTLDQEMVEDFLLQSRGAGSQYETDAEEYLERCKDLIAEKIESKRAQPDKLVANAGGKFTVMYENEEDLDSVYEANLVRVDFKRFGYSAFLFYKIQLCRDDIKNMYLLLTKWGQIGEEGMCQKTPFKTLEEGVAEFKKIFKAKTSNHWDQRADFQISKAKNKYTLFKINKFDTQYKDLLVPFKYEDSPRSELDDQLQSFMKQLTSIGMYNEVLKMNQIDNNQLNMSHLPKDTLLKAREILEKVDKKVKKNRNIYHPKFEDTQKKILKLSNDFFTLMPMTQFIDKIAEPLTRNNIEQYRNKLNDMITLERASKMLLGAQSRKSLISPLDYVFNALNTSIEPLIPNQEEYQIIYSYIKNTGKQNLPRINVSRIYKIQRQEDSDNFTKKNLDKDPQRILLFHGTRQQNLLGILSCGLKVAPMGVQQLGQAFGSGIYFADQFDKSFNYTQPFNPQITNTMNASQIQDLVNQEPKRYMLICEVALGKLVKFESMNYANQFSAIGTQKQLKDIVELLKKEEEQAKMEDEVVEPLHDDYGLEDDYDDELDMGKDDEEEEEGIGMIDANDEGPNEKGPVVVKKGEINEVDGKTVYGKDVDPTRTFRGHRLMKLTSDKRTNRFDTLWVSGNQIPDPAFNILMKDGCIVPTGEPVQVKPPENKNPNNRFYYGGYGGIPQSEFVVRHPERVKIRYLIEMTDKTPEQLVAVTNPVNDDLSD